MTRNQGLILTAAAAITAAAIIPFAAHAFGAPQPGAPAAPATRPTTSTAPSTTPSTQPKALTDNVQNALKWLASQQASDGGWAQGEESANMGNGMTAIKDKSNVGDTCMAVLALLRSGSSPSAGPYAENIRKGIDFVAAQVDKSPAEGLSITTLQGTRIQGKLGPNIDSFLAALMLGEIRNQMPDEKSHKLIIASLDKVMDKIEKNQKSDGRVADGGWAPSLAQGVAAKAANQAAANGANVDEKTLRQFEDFSASQQVASAGPVASGAGGAGAAGGMGRTGAGTLTLGGGAGYTGATTVASGAVTVSGAGGVVSASGGTLVTSDSAGVALYAHASNLSSLQNAQDRLEYRAKEIQGQLDAPTTQAADKEKLQTELKDINGRIEGNGENLRRATDAVKTQINDPRFIAGFGSNGGEEFLSYLNLGETLYKKGGDDWKNWDTKMTTNLNNIQNKDGSWSGQHCITSRTFCTSAALLVLMIDRESKEIGDQIKRRSAPTP